MKKLLIGMILILLGIISYYLMSHPFENIIDPQTIHWVDTNDTAAIKSKNQKKPIFAYYYTKQCHYCGKISEIMSTNKPVIKLINSDFIPVKIDADEHMDLMLKNDITKFPAFYFYDSSGHPIYKFYGYMDAHQLFNKLAMISNIYRDQQYQNFPHQAAHATSVPSTHSMVCLQTSCIPDKDIKSYFTESKTSELNLLAFFIAGIYMAFTPCNLMIILLIAGYILNINKQKNNIYYAILAAIFTITLSLTYSILGVLSVRYGHLLGDQLSLQIVSIILSCTLLLLSFIYFNFFHSSSTKSIEHKFSSRKIGVLTIAEIFLLSCVFVFIASSCSLPPLFSAMLYTSQTQNYFIGGSALFLTGLGSCIPLIAIPLFGIKIMPTFDVKSREIKSTLGSMLMLAAIWFIMPAIPVDIRNIIWSAGIITIMVILQYKFKHEQSICNYIFPVAIFIALVFLIKELYAILF